MKTEWALTNKDGRKTWSSMKQTEEECKKRWEIMGYKCEFPIWDVEQFKENWLANQNT